MERLITHLLLVLLGGTVLQVALSDAHLAYVQPGFQPLLAGAGAVLLLGGMAGFVLDRPQASARDEPAGSDEEAEHDHVPWSSWLLVLPVAVLLLVAPPALGVFTVERQSQQLAAAGDAEPPGGVRPGADGVRDMSVLEYGMWALAEDSSYVAEGPVRLQGFVVPRGDDTWYLSRIRIGCCAADAVPTSVVIAGEPATVGRGEWVEVEGTWAPPVTHPDAGYPEPVLKPRSITSIAAPANPYES